MSEEYQHQEVAMGFGDAPVKNEGDFVFFDNGFDVPRPIKEGLFQRAWRMLRGKPRPMETLRQTLERKRGQAMSAMEQSLLSQMDEQARSRARKPRT